MKLRIGLDCDDTCNFWYEYYLKRFGTPKDDATITRNVTRVLRKDRDFWLNLPVKHRPDFDVALYCTKRVNPKSWTKKWLEDNNFPKAPIYQVVSQNKNKADVIRGRVDVFIDDSVKNFIALNLAGIPCLLMDTPGNEWWGPIGRVYSLQESEIQEVYDLFMTTVFPNFRNLL